MINEEFYHQVQSFRMCFSIVYYAIEFLLDFISLFVDKYYQKLINEEKKISL